MMMIVFEFLDFSKTLYNIGNNLIYYLFITLATMGVITLVTRGFLSNKGFISLTTMGFSLVTISMHSFRQLFTFCFLGYSLYSLYLSSDLCFNCLLVVTSLHSCHQMVSWISISCCLW